MGAWLERPCSHFLFLQLLFATPSATPRLFLGTTGTPLANQLLKYSSETTPRGEMGEWLKPDASKASVPERAPGVRIPLSPP